MSHEEDESLGWDGLESDEMVSEYLRRGDRLIARVWEREQEIDPAEAVAALDTMAAIDRGMEAVCRRQGTPVGDYPARALVAERTAAAIRRSFGVEGA